LALGISHAEDQISTIGMSRYAGRDESYVTNESLDRRKIPIKVYSRSMVSRITIAAASVGSCARITASRLSRNGTPPTPHYGWHRKAPGNPRDCTRCSEIQFERLQ
jgi:hypothetical protein